MPKRHKSCDRSAELEIRRACLSVKRFGKEVISMTILGEMLVKDGLDRGIREGFQKGLRQGEEKLGRLIQLLIRNSRSDEIDRAVSDRQYQEALYREFGL